MKEPEGVKSNSNLIPIVLGVTGHRDLRPEDISQLEEKVHLIFRELQDSYPHTPLILLSPLAEGADRLVASVALKSGAGLVVPLPLTKDEYEKDFLTQQSINEFNSFLMQAKKSFEIPPANYHYQDRDSRYANVGAYIVQNSHILISLWDGTDTGLKGGTAQIMRFRLEGVPEPFVSQHNVLDPPDTGPVYHIVTPRIKNPKPKGKAFSFQIHFPSGWNTGEAPEAALINMLRYIDDFNHDAIKISECQYDEILRIKQRIVSTNDQEKIPPYIHNLLERFALADNIALYFQKKRRNSMVTLFALAVLAFFFFEVYAHLFRESMILGLYPGTLIIATFIFIYTKRRRFHDKHLDYRALAEGLRIQVFWWICGIKDNVTQYYLRKQKGELEWIRKAIGAYTLLPYQDIGNKNGEVGLRTTLDSWVKGQTSYFQKATARDHLRHKKEKTWVYSMFLLGILIALLVILMDLRFIDFYNNEAYHHLLIVIMGLAPALAAAVDGYCEKMAFASQTKVYKRMYYIFNRAESLLEERISNNDYQTAEQLIRELGREALLENGDWVLLHRDRPMKIPISG